MAKMSKIVTLPGGVTMPRPRGMGRVRQIKSRRGPAFNTWQPELRVKDKGYEPLGQTFATEGEAWQALITAQLQVSTGSRPTPGTATRSPRPAAPGAHRSSAPRKPALERPTSAPDRLPENATVEQWAKRWLQTKIVWPEGAPRPANHSTIIEYRRYIDEHIVPRLGGYALVEIQEDYDVIADWVKWLREKRVKTTRTGQLSAKTVHNIFNMARTMFGDAVRSPSAKGVTTNPLLMRYDLPTISSIKAGVRTPSRDEIDAVLDAVPDWVRDTLLFAIYTGLRYGEYAGLQRKHRLYQDGQLTHVRVEQTWHKNGSYFGPTKTHATRWQPLNQTAREALERSLRRWPAKHEEGCEGEPCQCDPNALLWRSERGKILRNEKIAVQISKAIGTSKNIDPFRVHDLRRAFGQWLLDDQVAMAEIQKLYAHTNERTTRLYVEAGRAPSADVVNLLDRPDRHLRVV